MVSSHLGEGPEILNMIERLGTGLMSVPWK